jgi:hypothetical protein
VVDNFGRINLVGKRQELGQLTGVKTIEDNLRSGRSVMSTDLMLAAPFARQPLRCCAFSAVPLRS